MEEDGGGAPGSADGCVELSVAQGDDPQEHRVIQVRWSSLCKLHYVQEAVQRSRKPLTRAAIMATRLANTHVHRMLAEGKTGEDIICHVSWTEFFRHCMQMVFSSDRFDYRSRPCWRELGANVKMVRTLFGRSCCLGRTWRRTSIRTLWHRR